MAAINQIITLGIGTPSGVPPFITFGFQLGSSTATVPNVVGNAQATAVASIEGAGFVAAVQYAYDGVVASGNVISQDPTAGSTATVGSTVTIIVSIGAAPSTGTQPRNKRRRGRSMATWGR